MNKQSKVTRSQIAYAMELRTMGLSWRQVGVKMGMPFGTICTAVRVATTDFEWRSV